MWKGFKPWREMCIRDRDCAKKFKNELPENLERRMNRYMLMAGKDIVL